MADTKISALTAASSVSGTDILPIVQSATTKSATLAQVAGLVSGGGGTTSRVAGSNFTTSSTSFVNITGLTFAASANTLYEIDGLLRVSIADTLGLRVTIAYSAAGAVPSVLIWGGTGASGAAGATVEINAGNTQSGILSNENGVIKSVYFKGWMSIGANTGNITLQVFKVTSGTATVYIGSRLTVT